MDIQVEADQRAGSRLNTGTSPASGTTPLSRPRSGAVDRGAVPAPSRLDPTEGRGIDRCKVGAGRPAAARRFLDKALAARAGVAARALAPRQESDETSAPPRAVRLRTGSRAGTAKIGHLALRLHIAGFEAVIAVDRLAFRPAARGRHAAIVLETEIGVGEFTLLFFLRMAVVDREASVGHPVLQRRQLTVLVHGVSGDQELQHFLQDRWSCCNAASSTRPVDSAARLDVMSAAMLPLA